MPGAGLPLGDEPRLTITNDPRPAVRETAVLTWETTSMLASRDWICACPGSMGNSAVAGASMTGSENSVTSAARILFVSEAIAHPPPPRKKERCSIAALFSAHAGPLLLPGCSTATIWPPKVSFEHIGTANGYVYPSIWRSKIAKSHAMCAGHAPSRAESWSPTCSNRRW